MEEDCMKYAHIDTNNLILKTANFSYRLTSTVSLLYLATASVYAAGPLAIPRFNDSMDRQLLLNMDLPFDTNESPAYELVIPAQFLHQTASAYTFGVFNAFLLMVVSVSSFFRQLLINVVLTLRRPLKRNYGYKVSH